MKSYGYHIKATLADGSVEERDIISPLLTVANSRHIGGGIEVSPYSRFADGLLDLVWLDHVPNFRECVDAVARATTADCWAAMLSDGSGCMTLKSPAPPKGMSLRC